MYPGYQPMIEKLISSNIDKWFEGSAILKFYFTYIGIIKWTRMGN